MGWHPCSGCNGRGIHGWIPRWLWLWGILEDTCLERFIAIDCEGCGGDGKAKPPGWPDQEAMRRMRPPAPSSPPPPLKR